MSRRDAAVLVAEYINRAHVRTTRRRYRDFPRYLPYFGYGSGSDSRGCCAGDIGGQAVTRKIIRVGISNVLRTLLPHKPYGFTRAHAKPRRRLSWIENSCAKCSAGNAPTAGNRSARYFMRITSRRFIADGQTHHYRNVQAKMLRKIFSPPVRDAISGRRRFRSKISAMKYRCS